MFQTAPNHRLRASLILDAAVELLLGAVLLALPSTLGRWLGIAPQAVIGAGFVFVAAAVAVGAIAYRAPGRPRLVQILGWTNIAGGVVGWAVLLLTWGALAAPGRALLGSASDVFIAVGALELIYLRRGHHLPTH